ncbi:Major facilitator superfamily [Macrophomina phaseolina MS6]|uniref:Major facilitator superfamily n=1 Tax=Macrophomina phaseolina (strain MS6) TaxID=1126212 RepID=K2RZE2_MACPH|nr:Major facilitator superfamily [Macrophomina phaseolina MS6]
MASGFHIDRSEKAISDSSSASLKDGFFETRIKLVHRLQGYSSSAVAWIISLNTFLTFAGAPFFGRVFDSHGPRGMMLLGITMHVLGLMMTSLSTKYWHFVLAQSICSGMGSGAILYASLNSVATWFRERRALALGIASSGSGVSGIVTPIVFNKLRVEIGFAWAIRCIAFMFLGLLTVAALTVRSRLRPNSEPWRLADFAHPFKSRCFVSTTLAAFVFHMGLYVPMNYITLQALDEGMSENLAGYLISIMNGASVLGRILLGRLGDKAGRYNCLIGSASVSALVVLLVWLPGHGNAAFIVFSALVGFSLGGYIALLPACVAQAL